MKDKINITFHPKAEDEILALPKKLQARVARIMDMMESLNTAELGAQYTKSLKDGIFELRAKADTNIARSLFFYMSGNTVVFVSAFVKKTQKTPLQQLKIAQKRRKECKDGTIKLR